MTLKESQLLHRDCAKPPSELKCCQLVRNSTKRSYTVAVFDSIICDLSDCANVSYLE